MILVDTTVLVYAAGAEHALRDPCRRLLRTHREGGVEATTTGEVVQEFMHVYGRRRSRSAAAELGRRYLAALPLLFPTRAEIEIGLDIYEHGEAMGAFDSVLAGVTLGRGLDGLISADRAFGTVPGLNWIAPGTPRFDALVDGTD